jgi:uncharacterized Ntn-hydrolase superfamily protein
MEVNMSATSLNLGTKGLQSLSEGMALDHTLDRIIEADTKSTYKSIQTNNEIGQ